MRSPVLSPLCALALAVLWLPPIGQAEPADRPVPIQDGDGDRDRDRERMASASREQSTLLPADAPLEAAVAKIRRAGIVSSHEIGYEGARSGVYDAYLRLAATASVDQLRAWTRDASPALRVYAFYALAERAAGAARVDALLAGVEDPEWVATQSGCILAREPVADLVLRRVWDQLDARARDRVLALLLEHPGELASRRRALLEWELPGSLRARVRERALAGDTAALVALARFAVEADAPLFERGLRENPGDALAALRLRPDLVSMDALRRVQRELLAARVFGVGRGDSLARIRTLLETGPPRNAGRTLCLLYTLAAHLPAEHGAELFERALDPLEEVVDREAHARCIAFALAPDPGRHTEWAWRAWEHEHQLFLETARVLWKRDPWRTLHATLNGVAHSNAYGSDVHTWMLERMREAATPEEAIAALDRAIPVARSELLGQLLPSVRVYEASSSVPLLFDRLENRRDARGEVISVEWNGNVATPVVQTLLAYDLTQAGQRRLLHWFFETADERMQRAGSVDFQLETERDLRALLVGHGLLEY